MGDLDTQQRVFRMKIASKRQVTLPQKLVSQLRLSEGDELEIVTNGSEITEVRPLKLVPTTFFTERIRKLLDEREKEFEAGGGFELPDVSELRRRGKSRASSNGGTSGAKS
jgi:AbrB family looped-hinge helix DNA binding protein